MKKFAYKKYFNMKRKILFFVMMFTLAGLFTMQSCKEDVTPYTEFGSFTDPVVLAPADGGFISVTGTTVELTWESTDAENDAQAWDVYFGTASTPPLVASGVSTQSYTATVEPGGDYYWRVITKDAKGVITRSPTWSFSVVDPDADMVLTMSWATDVATAIGLELDPTEAADLRLLIIDPSDNSYIAVEDGSSFEEYSGFNDLDDGTYLIGVDFYSTIDAGDFNEPLSISIDLNFDQLGTLSSTLSFPDVMNNLSPCSAYYTILAEVVKEGKTYTFAKKISYAWSVDINDLVGDWAGEDNYGFVDNVTTTVSDGQLFIYGLGVDMIENWWGEPVIASNPVPVIFDWATLGEIAIEDQYYFTTIYGGSEYEYNIVATGLVSMCGAEPSITITYDIKYTEDGWSIGGYLNDNYGGGIFTITLTPDSGGKGLSAIDSKGMSSSKLTSPQKPVK